MSYAPHPNTSIVFKLYDSSHAYLKQTALEAPSSQLSIRVSRSKRQYICANSKYGCKPGVSLTWNWALLKRLFYCIIANMDAGMFFYSYFWLYISDMAIFCRGILFGGYSNGGLDRLRGCLQPEAFSHHEASPHCILLHLHRHLRL